MEEFDKEYSETVGDWFLVYPPQDGDGGLKGNWLTADGPESQLRNVRQTVDYNGKIYYAGGWEDQIKI